RSLLWAETLAGRAREAVHVGVLYGPNVLLVHHVFRPDNSLQILQVGASIPWHACALGKAMVAYLDADAQAELLGGPLPRLTGRTLTGRDALEAELAAVDALGVAVEDQEAIVGEAGIAAALFDNRGAVVGAIGLAGPGGRLPAGRGGRRGPGRAWSAGRGAPPPCSTTGGRWSAPSGWPARWSGSCPTGRRPRRGPRSRRRPPGSPPRWAPAARAWPAPA